MVVVFLTNSISAFDKALWTSVEELKANQGIIIKKLTKVEKAVANFSAASDGNNGNASAPVKIRSEKQVLLEDYELPLQKLLRMPDLSVAVKLSGDGRCDSPGHSAKFCCHSLMHYSKIVDVQLVQSNEVANSNCMEGEGLKRGVEQLRREHSPTDAQKLRGVERAQDRCKNHTPSRRKRDSKRHRVRRKQEVGKSVWTDEFNRMSQSARRIFPRLQTMNRARRRANS